MDSLPYIGFKKESGFAPPACGLCQSAGESKNIRGRESMINGQLLMITRVPGGFVRFNSCGGHVPGCALKGQPSWPVGSTRNPAQGRATPPDRGGAAPWVSVRHRRPPLPRACEPPPALPCRAGGGSQSEGSGGFSFGTRTPGCRAASRRFTLGWVDLPLRGAPGHPDQQLNNSTIQPYSIRTFCAAWPAFTT